MPRTYAFTKRALDVFAALVGLAVLAPVLPLLVLAIRLDSDGPALVRHLVVGVQRRRTRADDPVSRRVHDVGGRLVRVIAFRSAHWEHDHVVDAATRVGTWLRRTRLERWPCLVNVLLGHLTLVGPRPLSPTHVDRLRREAPVYVDSLLGVRPGLIGGTLGGGGDFWGVVGARVLFDVPYARRLAEAATWRAALAVDLGVLRDVLLRPLASRRAHGNEVIRIDYPRSFGQLPFDPHELARRTPVGMGADVQDNLGPITAWWYPPRRHGLAGGLSRRDPAAHADDGAMPLADECCGAAREASADEIVLAVPLAHAPGDDDVLRIEVPQALHDVQHLCEHLHPVWEQLADRSADPHFALKQNLIVLESLKRMRGVSAGTAAGGRKPDRRERPDRPDRRDRLVLEIRVQGDRLVMRVARAEPGPGLLELSARWLTAGAWPDTSVQKA